MYRTAAKYLLLITFFSAFAISPIFAQTLTIGPVDPGPYGHGSTIAIPFHIDDTGGCIDQSNKFSLYMSDATGNFTSTTPVATITGFYATFFNYKLPNTLPAGSGYKFLIKSSVPALTSNTSNAVTVNNTGGISTAASSSSISKVDTTVYGQCSGSSSSYVFTNSTTGAITVTASFFNELTQAFEASNIDIMPGYSFNAKLANYTVMVKAVNGAGIVGTRAYQLINNQVSTTIGFTGNPTVCLSPSGAPLTYSIDYTSANGIEYNYPGNLYTLSWGDGSPSTILTLCQIKALLGRVTHNYLKPSCGNVVNGQVNAFAVNFKATNTYCGQVGSLQTSYARIILAPTNYISAPSVACTSSAVSFFNGSNPGPDPNATVATCSQNPNALYTWLVDGVVNKQNYKLSQRFIYTFSIPGVHYVTIHAQTSNGTCVAPDYTDTICIQNPPRPVFTFPVHTICVGGGPAIPINASIVDSTCSTNNQYLWSVTGPAAVIYSGGTNKNSRQPQFSFSAAGIYTVQLSILACDTVKSPMDTLIVNSLPTAVLSNDFSICGPGKTFNFNAKAANNPTYTILTGTSQEQPTTYKWIVIAPDGARPATLNDTSKYPQIFFPDVGTYTITVTQQNNCGTASSTQHITFLQSPTVMAGGDTTICASSSANLHATINGTANSQQWTGGTGTFSAGRNSLQTTYTPSPAEINAGQVTLMLVVTTSSAPPCDTIRNIVIITILPADTVTSAASKIICSGQSVNYTITASKPSSTFTWTAAVTSGTATGFTNSGGNKITDVITNTSPPGVTATVTYTIIPTNGQCPGKPFNLVVSLPDVAASFTTAPKSGCGDLTVQFTNTSNGQPATTYAWNFGDGSTSTAVSPQHTFAARADGRDTTYIISLSITNNCVQRAPVIDSVIVRSATTVARILPKQTVGCGTLTLDVQNISPGGNLSYDFYLYDGATLVQKITKTDKTDALFNTVTPTSAKTYTLYMIATGYCNNTAESVHIPITVSSNNLVAQTFIQNSIDKGCAPFSVTFVNNSSGGDNFHYNIYDSNSKLVDQPIGSTGPLTYTFTNTGTFYVTLTASNSCGSVESSPKIRIDVYAVPKPDFSADIITGCKNITVSFSNLTTDSTAQATSLSYDWDFGDGSTHSASFTPPPHAYHYINSPYTVTLTATNTATGCSGTVTKNSYIVIISPPGTEFTENPDSVTSIPNFHFSFIDKTSGSPVSWKWTFSDGQTSTLRNPGITFPDTGLYKVTLTAAGATGCDSTRIHYVRIGGVPGQLYLPNAFIPSSATTELRVFMAKGSGIKTWLLQIFNKYGQLVWQTSKLDSQGAPVEGWDGIFNGAPVPQGVYVWQASATFINGNQWKGMSYNGSLPKRVGSIHLIR